MAEDEVAVAMALAADEVAAAVAVAPTEAAAPAPAPAAERVRLEEEIKKEERAAAELVGHIGSRRARSGAMETEERQKAAAHHEAVQARIASRLAELIAREKKAVGDAPPPADVDVVANLRAIRTGLDAFAARADDLEANTRAIARHAVEGPAAGEETGEVFAAIGRRAASLREVSDVLVDCAKEMQAALTRALRLLEPRL